MADDADDKAGHQKQEQGLLHRVLDFLQANGDRRGSTVALLILIRWYVL